MSDLQSEAAQMRAESDGSITYLVDVPFDQIVDLVDEGEYCAADLIFAFAEIQTLRAEVERMEKQLASTLTELDGAAKVSRALAQKAAELQARVDALDAGYTEAIEDISEWAAYASEYFQNKHDLEGCISRHKARLISALNM